MPSDPNTYYILMYWTANGYMQVPHSGHFMTKSQATKWIDNWHRIASQEGRALERSEIRVFKIQEA